VVAALTENGRDDVLYDMVTQDAGPGYAYQLKKDATTLTEAWDTNPASSQNHCMLGHAEEWFYRGLGGIRPAAPGFREITIKPAVVGSDLGPSRLRIGAGQNPLCLAAYR
jgi:hypothetical protein